MSKSSIAGVPVVRIVAQGGGAASTPQPVPPLVVTGDPILNAGTATAVATFRADVNPRGHETVCIFRYKVVGSTLNIATQPVTLPAGSATVEVTAESAPIALDEDFTVAAFAYHTEGPALGQVQNGGDVSFSTPPATATQPPRAVTLPNDPPAATSVRLYGKVNPLGTESYISFELTGPTGIVTTAAPITVGNGSAFVTTFEDVIDLDPDSDYSYFVKAINDVGQTASGLPVSFHTQPAAVGGPPTIINEPIVVSNITDVSADVAVEFDTGGVACDLRITFVDADPMPATGLPQSQTHQIAATEVSHTASLANLTASTDWTIRARISNQFQPPDVSDTVEFTTLAAGDYPTGDTTLPDKINQTYATLQAVFNNNGDATGTTVRFYYETTLALLQSAPLTIDSSGTGTGSTATEFTARPTGLSPYTVYYYKAVATNGVGVRTGQVGSFRTAGGTGAVAPTVVTTAGGALLTDTAATVRGTITHYGTPTAYYFEYWITGQDKKYTQITLIDFPIGGLVAAVSSVFERLNGLAANQAYNVRLVAVNAGSPDVQTDAGTTFTTNVAPGVPAATGHVGTVSSILSTSVRVTGTVETNGEDTNCRIQASTTSVFTAIAAQSTDETVTDNGFGITQDMTDVALVGLSPNTNYYFRCRYEHLVGPIVSYSTNILQFRTSSYATPTLSAVSVPAGGINPNDALLIGTVTIPAADGGGDTWVWAGYGEVDNTGAPLAHANYTPQVNIGASPGATPVSIPLTDLTAGTLTYCHMLTRRDFTGNAASSQVSFTTDAGSSSNLSVVTIQPAKVITPYSFHMHGLLDTNGDDVDVEFEYWSVGYGTQASPYGTTAVQTITDSAYTVLIGDHTVFLPGPDHASAGGVDRVWQYQIKTTQGGEVKRSSSLSVTCPTPTEDVPPVFINQGTGFIDAQSARPRTHLKHRQGKRVFMYLEIAESAADLTSASGTYQRGRWVSYIGPTNTVTKPDGSVQFPEVHYSQKFDSLTENTTYHWRCVAWSVLGIHTGPISTFTTDVLAGNWSASWVASVGTQLPARGLAGPVPKDLRDGTGTRTYPTSSTDTASGVVWGADDYAAGEADYTILVTPTGVTCLGTHPGTDLVRDDTDSNSNIAYAFRQARVGDIIRVEGYNATTATGHAGFGIYYTTRLGPSGIDLTTPLSVGATYRDAAGTYTAKCVHATGRLNRGTSSNPIYYSVARFRILTGNVPARGVVTGGVMAQGLDVLLSTDLTNGAGNVQVHQSGPYTYSGVSLGDDTDNTSAYWGAARKPITGVRVQAQALAAKYGLTGIDNGNREGGCNGVFFKDAIIDSGPIPVEYVVDSSGGADNGVGVLGIYKSEFKASGLYVYNWGRKTPIRLNCPVTQDIRNNTYSPSNEHFDYADAIGGLGNGNSFICDNTITGTSGDGLKTYNQRSHVQLVSRGDAVQGSATGSGYAPGEGDVYILRGTHRGGNSAGTITPWGHFGHIYVDGCSHLPIPTTVAAGGYVGAETRQFLVLPDDTSKGMWLNERGFATGGLHIGTLTAAGNSSSVNNADAGFYGDIRNCEVVEIGHFTFAVTPNNQKLFKLMESTARDNGRVTFSGTYPTGLFAYPNWPAQTAVPVNNRIQHSNVPINAIADYTKLETEGYQYVAIQ